MIYTIGRLIEDFRTIAGEASSDFWGSKAKQIAEEALTVFLSSKWPFNRVEGSFATVAPYATGTVAVVNGSALVNLTGGTWDTSWPVPAVIRINGSSGDAILVSTFNSASQLTLDLEDGWPFDSDPTATYSIEFPCYPIASYLSVTGLAAARLSTMIQLHRASLETMLAKRPWTPSSFWPGEYDVIPSDGNTSQKIWIWPPPASVQTFRYEAVKAIPDFRYYRTGVASLANGAAALTGVGTDWLKLGYTLVGQYFEFLAQPGHQNAVSAVATDTTATVSSNYLGVSGVQQPYCISPRIYVPDDLKPLLRSIVRWLYLEDAAPSLAPAAKDRYRLLRDQAIARADVARDISAVQPIMTGDVDWGGPPPLPAVMHLE